MGRPTSSRTSTSRTSVQIRVSKRRIEDSDDEIERRAADRKPSHSGEKKKKYNEDHLRYNTNFFFGIKLGHFDINIFFCM